MKPTAISLAKQALHELQSISVSNGTSRMTMDEINAEIAAYHNGHDIDLSIAVAAL
jgi:hypothetical protein